jgi:hypothetical protein
LLYAIDIARGKADFRFPSSIEESLAPFLLALCKTGTLFLFKLAYIRTRHAVARETFHFIDLALVCALFFRRLSLNAGCYSYFASHRRGGSEWGHIYQNNYQQRWSRRRQHARTHTLILTDKLLKEKLHRTE